MLAPTKIRTVKAHTYTYIVATRTPYMYTVRVMSDDDTYSSDDPKDIKERKQQEKNAVSLEADDLKYLMSLAQFRRFMWNMLEFCQVFGVADPHAAERATGFFDGQKNVGLKHFANIQEHCPDRFAEMTKEANKKGYAYHD